MNSSVKFLVTAGSMKDQSSDFKKHDTFLFGRLEGCHCSKPDEEAGVAALRIAHKL